MTQSTTTNITCLIRYKFNRLSLEQLIGVAEKHANIVARGNLTKIEKYHCLVVFRLLYEKATTDEVKQLMMVMLRVMRFF